MRKPKGGPTWGQDLATLADLYLTFLWMLRQRLQHGPGWQYHHRWAAAHPGAPAETAAGAAERDLAAARRG